MERFIMTNEGRISVTATWILVATYHDVSVHFLLRRIMMCLYTSCCDVS
jgi:hypothetical protein